MFSSRPATLPAVWCLTSCEQWFYQRFLLKQPYAAAEVDRATQNAKVVGEKKLKRHTHTQNKTEEPFSVGSSKQELWYTYGYDTWF